MTFSADELVAIRGRVLAVTSLSLTHRSLFFTATGADLYPEGIPDEVFMEATKLQTDQLSHLQWLINKGCPGDLYLKYYFAAVQGGATGMDAGDPIPDEAFPQLKAQGIEGIEAYLTHDRERLDQNIPDAERQYRQAHIAASELLLHIFKT